MRTMSGRCLDCLHWGRSEPRTHRYGRGLKRAGQQSPRRGKWLNDMPPVPEPFTRAVPGSRFCVIDSGGQDEPHPGTSGEDKATPSHFFRLYSVCPKNPGVRIVSVFQS